jgi:hypothetical protein
VFRRPLDERDYRYDGGGGADRWGPDTDRRRDAHPYNPDPHDRLPPSERLNAGGGGYSDGGPAAFAAGYAGGDRYERYPGESVPYEAAAGRDYYPEERVAAAAAARKYPNEDDFQTLRQRYDEEY